MSDNCELRIPFEVGCLMRSSFEKQIHMFLAPKINITYELKTLHKGWLDSSYLLTIKGPAKTVTHLQKVLLDWSDSHNEEK